MAKGEVKRRKVNYHLIEPASVDGAAMYPLLEDLVFRYRNADLIEARIALAWCTSWKPDVDGRVILGKLVKATELHRELAAYDFIVLLRKSWWQDNRVTAAQRRALLHHELCHGALAHDKDGSPILDEKGRLVYRVRKHDLEEFHEVIREHGAYTGDIAEAWAALRAHDLGDWTSCGACVNGYVAIEKGVVERCACWTQHHARRQAHVADGDVVAVP